MFDYIVFEFYSFVFLLLYFVDTSIIFVYSNTIIESSDNIDNIKKRK